MLPRRRSRRVALTVAGIAGALTMAHSYLSLHPHPFERVSNRAIRLSKTHQISIAYGQPSTFFVPPYGPQDAVPAEVKMSEALPENLSAALEGVELALDKYPAGFVASLVRAIFIAGSVKVNAEQSGGFTGPAWFVLAASDLVSAETIRLNALEGVHHELSSFVFRRVAVTDQWAALAPRGWAFTANNETALANGGGPEPSPDTGFLSPYGATTAENDFNTYAERIFTQPNTLVRLACERALVRNKLLIVLRAYVTLDARMETVFRGLGIDAAHLCDRRWRWPLWIDR